MELILDKSFLHAVSSHEISEISRNYFVIMPDVLFYELITTREDSRRRCFNNIPDLENPVALLPGIGELLRYEINMKRPCIPLSERCLKGKYRFNTRLRDGTFQFFGEVSEETVRLTAETENYTRDFIEICMIVDQFFPEIKGIPFKKFPCAIQAAKNKIACNPDFIRSIYQSFIEHENSSSDWPTPSQIDGDWAFFRRVQCQLLAALRLFLRYQGRIPNDAGVPFWTNAEHYLHDFYYLIFGTLTGALASNDREVIEDFRLLCPKRILLTTLRRTTQEVKTSL